MADQYREAIEDDDMQSLKDKFVGGGRPAATTEKPVQPERARETVGAERASTYNKLLTKVAARDQGDDDSDDHAHTVVHDAHRGAQHIDVQSQVTHLMDIASTKGAVHAVKVARHMSDFFILDQLHDKMLADAFHEALMKKGML